MQDLCPLCLRNGAKNTVKPIQINLQEAVWMCESEKCVWPFGYKELIFVPRVVGKAWSCYWADDKMTNSRIRENILTSSESLANQQSLTRISDAPKVFKTASRLDHDVEQNIDIMSMRNVNVKIEYESQPLEMTFPYEELDATQYNVAQSQQNGDKYNASNEKVYNSSTNCFDKSDLSYLFSGNSNVTNVPEVDNDRKFPVITNVEKTNINVKMDDSNSFDKDILNNIKKEDIALTVTKSELDNEKFETENFNERNLISSVLDNKQCLDQKYSKYIVDSTKIEIDTSQQINITKMEVDGLPPITLTYETPACTTIDVKPMSVRKTESSETETTSMVNHPAVANGKATVQTGLCKKPNVQSLQTNKRQIFRGRQYEKFSFSAFKKKSEPTGNDDKNESNNCNSKINTVPTSVNVKSSTINQNNSLPIAKPESVSNNSGQANTSLSDNSLVNSSVNIDTALEDIFSNGYEVSEDINDDWLDSLFN